MTDGDQPAPSPYDLPHLNVSAFGKARDYLSTGTGSQGNGPMRQRALHANRLLGEIQQARAQLADSVFGASDTFDGGRGATLEVETAAGGRLPDLEKRTQDIRVGAVKHLPNGSQQALLVMPEAGLVFWEERLVSYRDDDTQNGNPRYQSEVESLEHLRLGRLEAFWTDTRLLPEPGVSIWWECWCWPDRVDALLRAAERLRLHVSQQRLFFPNMTVLMVYADRAQIDQVIGNSFAVAELRRASDTPHFFVKEPTDANLWTQALADRVTAPTGDDVAVCLLDTGLNRAHPLLVPATADVDCHVNRPGFSGGSDL